MRPNSISPLIIQLFDLVSNGDTGEAARAEPIRICRGSTWKVFSPSHLSVRKQIYGLFVSLRWKLQPGCCKKSEEKQAEVMGVFSYLGSRFDFNVLGGL